MHNKNNITQSGLEYKVIQPDQSLGDYVECFWMIKNSSDKQKDIILLPDGRFDIIFFFSANKPLTIMQMGLSIKPEQNSVQPEITMFGISFKLLAIEYLLNMEAGFLFNNSQPLPINFWEIEETDFTDFENFCKKVTTKMLSLIKTNIETRKQKLFQLIYSSNGTITVSELSKKVFWESRQINRYFNQRFGVSLKTYSNILRFKSSLPHIKVGKLFPELKFYDQTHFIKEIKRFSGVVPKELSKNKNDRFILLSTMPNK